MIKPCHVMRLTLVISLHLSSIALAQDVAAGKAAFAQCAACHSVETNNGVGPGLRGVMGRRAGEFAGFRFSQAMKNAATVWDVKSLDAFIANPQKNLPGNAMPFAGMQDAKQRADLLAYLATLK